MARTKGTFRVGNRSANFPKAIVVRDCTLREGEQAADITFSIDDKLQIARKL